MSSKNKKIAAQSRSLFAERIRKIVKSIPKGQVLTYGEVARQAGSPGAARAVGTVMKGNYDRAVPCHRVVRSDGRIGAYNRGGPKKKAALLMEEGVSIVKGVVQKSKSASKKRKK